MIKKELEVGKHNTALSILTPLNLNFTEKLVQNLYESNRSWQVVSGNFEAFMADQEALQKSIEESGPALYNKKLLQRQQPRKSDFRPTRNESASEDTKLNEETITPYVIINKTDTPLIVKRLFERDRRDLAESRTFAQRSRLINYYKLEPGQVIEYMLDYSQQKFKLARPLLEESKTEDEEQSDGAGDMYSSADANIHCDSIGEYKSEYIKIQFDAAQTESKFAVCKEIKKIDLNEHGYRTHILREGRFMEKVFYGVRLIDFKKVFTIRSQFQLLNLTGFDYLVHFRFAHSSVLKFLEDGDSLPLPMRLDESKIQIKMIDPQMREKDAFLQKLSKEHKCPRTGRDLCLEELHVQSDDVADFRDPRFKYKNWTAFIPLFILKQRLNFDDCSFLTNAQSRFTFIKKTRADHFEQIIDINMMPPMVVQNCLPFPLVLRFVDSSGISQQEVLTKNETRNLFCFTMSKSVIVDLLIEGFDSQTFKLFNLENYICTEDKIELKDKAGRKTTIYTQITRKQTGQKVIFYCKKLVLDAIDSPLSYTYKLPAQSIFTSQDPEKLLIPWVE